MQYKTLKLLTSRDGKTFIDPITKEVIPTTKFFPLNMRYFVNAHGHVFDSFNEYQKLKPYKINGHFFVDIEFTKSPKSIPFLLGEIMLATFCTDYKIGDRFTYKSKSRRCKLANLKHLPQSKLNAYPESELINWDCYNKANYANTRVLGLNAASLSITATDIYECLIRANFKCSYCGEAIIVKSKWHLDHVEPISKGGLNDKYNITPACVECNLMKHSLRTDIFFSKVLKIAQYMNLKNTGRFYYLDFTTDVVAKYDRVYLVPSEVIDN